MQRFNANNFVDFLHFTNFILPEEGMMELDEDEENGLIKISIGEHLFVIKRPFWKKFCILVQQENYPELLQKLGELGEYFKYQAVQSDELNKVPSVMLEKLEDVPAEVKDRVQQRLSGIVTLTGIKIKRLAEIINTRIDVVARDSSIIKDFDAYLTLDVDYEDGFKLFICFDKIQPIFEQPTDIQILRTRMTEPDIELYLGEEYKEIRKILDAIEDSINGLLESKLVSFSSLTKEFVVNLVNGSVVQHLMSITPVFISFGGVDNWRLFGDLTPNSEVCHKLLDQEVEYIVKYLKNIPLSEGVDYYAVDLNHLTVYGRNDLNKTVTDPIPQHSDHLSLRYSEGFFDLLLLRLKQSDNKICFVY